MTDASSEGRASRRGGILEGVRVLDLSRMLSGPYATMMLADHGAEVIKIESPEGDISRGIGPFRADDVERMHSGYFVSLNRSKKSVVLDLKVTRDREQLLRLVPTADVLVENFRPGVMERLGLGYELLRKHNPRLVYAAIRGFGDPRTGTSPYQDWPSYDVVAQAMAGLISVTGADREHPVKAGPGVGDIFSGLMASFGIVAALRQAERTGAGQFLDVAMYDCVLSLCERIVYQTTFTGTAPVPEGNGHPLLAPFGLFPARDGLVAIGCPDDSFWRALVTIMGRPELGETARFRDKQARCVAGAEVNRLVSEWSSRHTKAELASLLGGRVPFGPVNTAADILTDPHVVSRAMLLDVPHPDGAPPFQVAGNPLHFERDRAPAAGPPPRLGEHAAEILR